MKRIELQTSRRTEMVPITDQVQQAVDDSGVTEGVCYVQKMSGSCEIGRTTTQYRRYSYVLYR